MSFAAERPAKPANYKRAAGIIDRVPDQTRTPLPYELLLPASGYSHCLRPNGCWSGQSTGRNYNGGDGKMA
jgi:hypothetical protein